MGRITASELLDLQKRASKYIGKEYPTPMYITDANGRRKLQEVMCEFIGFTNTRISFKETQEGDAKTTVTFPIPTAKMKCKKGIQKTVTLDTVVAYFEAKELKA